MYHRIQSPKGDTMTKDQALEVIEDVQDMIDSKLPACRELDKTLKNNQIENGLLTLWSRLETVRELLD